MVSLESSKPFQRLHPAELKVLRQITKELNFDEGSHVFKEGDKGDGVYVVKDGLVEISVEVAQNDRRVFARLGPGEMFGEMAVLEFKPRSASAIAGKPTSVYFIPRNELLSMVERSPVLSLELLREISQRLREFNGRYIEEILQSERLAIIGRFARTIVHDLKNPLNIIGLTAEVSAMEKATLEMRTKASGTIRHQVDRINELVSDILEFTQGRVSSVVLMSMDYGRFVRSLLDDIGPEELKGSEIETGALPSLTISMDPKRLRRVFLNLIHNAVDAMPDGGKISLRLTVGTGEVVTEIEDTGPGIAPEIASKLFEVFATFGKAHGTGLGLSICKRIVEDHHGRIWSRQEPGRGAIFCFALPLVK